MFWAFGREALGRSTAFLVDIEADYLEQISLLVVTLEVMAKWSLSMKTIFNVCGILTNLCAWRDRARLWRGRQKSRCQKPLELFLSLSQSKVSR